MTPKLRVLLGCTLVAVPADQLTKYWIVTRIPLGERVSVIEGFFDLTHVRNSGAAFGLLAQAPDEWRFAAFALIGIVALTVISHFFRDLAPGDRFSALALALILGGAMGNMLDRIFRGEVVDFLHFRLVGGYAWPDFNLADMLIVSGVTALAIELLSAEGKSRAESSKVEEESERP
jgi:signal peptidase II